MKIKTPLIVGKVYWIFDGMMNPIQGELVGIENNGRTGIFSYRWRQVPRKTTSIYHTKEEALRIGKY